MADSEIIIGAVKGISIAIETLTKIVNALDGAVGKIILVYAGLIAASTLLNKQLLITTALKTKDLLLAPLQKAAAIATYV